MRKLKTIVNRVRSFPAYYNSYDALEASLSAEQKIAESARDAFDVQMITFEKSQPKELHPALKGISASGSKQASLLKELNDKLTSFPSDFHNLEEIYSEMNRKSSSLKDAQENALKSRIAATKNRSEAANLKAQEDEKNVAQLEKQTDQEIFDLRRRFVESLVASLKAVAEAKLKTAESMADVAKEFENCVSELHDYKDLALSKLSQKVDQLRYEIVE